MGPDDLMKYAIPVQEPHRQAAPVNANQSNDLMRYATPVEDIQEEPEESFPAKIGRVGTQVASRSIEGLLGLPGDIYTSARQFNKAIAEGVAGKELSFFKQTRGGEVSRRKMIPTSAELKERSEELTKGYTAPREEWEKELGDFVSNITTTAATSAAGGLGILKALGAAVTGGLLKEGTKSIGGSETSQQLADIGGNLLYTMYNPKGAATFAKSLYDKVRASPSAKAVIPTAGLSSELNIIKDKLAKGISTPQKEAVKKSIKNIEKKIVGGNIELGDLIEMKQDVNQIMGDPEILKRGKTVFPQVVKALNRTIATTKNTFPEFYKDISTADSIYRGLKQSEKVKKFIQKTVPPLAKHHKKSPLLAIGVAYYYGGLEGAALGASGIGLVKSYEFLSRLKNPAIRRFYVNSTKDAINENKVGLINNLTKLGREIKREDEED